MLALISGTGLSKRKLFDIEHRRIVRTPYGEPSSPISFGHISGNPVIQLARHGLGHFLAPHKINYRANIWALKELGATSILALGAVGALTSDVSIGQWVLPHDFIDHTWGRAHTFFDGPDKPVRHTEMTQPMCPSLRERIIHIIVEEGLPIVGTSVYVCAQGPRLETPAEARMYVQQGGHVIGMVSMPEAPLAKELDLSYVPCCLVTNFAAHRVHESFDGIVLTHDDSIFSPVVALLQRLNGELA